MTDRKQPTINSNNNKQMLKTIFDFIDDCSNRLALKEQERKKEEEEPVVSTCETEADAFSRYIRERILGRSWAELAYEEEEAEEAAAEAAKKQLDLERKAMYETQEYDLEEGEIFE